MPKRLSHLFPRFAVIGFVLALALSACGGGPEIPRHTTPAQSTAQAKPPTDVPYKLGRPYVIRGVRYVPRNDPHYNRTGMASWYGKQFHGRTTASGRKYNMYEMTAAHTTLPTGTQVKVTNLGNHRTVIVTITDRGPFAHGRIIDLSYAAAKQLGFVGQGTARVRVTFHKAARRS